MRATREPVWWGLLVVGLALALLAIAGAIPGWLGGVGLGLLVLDWTVWRSWKATSR